MRNFFEKGIITFNYENETSIKDLINLIININPRIKDIIISSQNNEFHLNSLILINGVEISVLNGLETKLSDKDEITFIPIIHGG
ncbi:MAG: hypothetical protein AC479_05270 [miscellaneous Crenarchaeota group-6 archaeon AD8-1]|nr:MAG: hypothetical protein AC479_05270 [miscellaneous Crenarchaeota group-6 archaeon AD8-1]